MSSPIHGVKWPISKVTKNKGMENHFFMVRFRICIGGVWFNFKVGFVVFNFGTFWDHWFVKCYLAYSRD